MRHRLSERLAAGTKNEKSQKLQARAPHEIIEAMEKVKASGESTAQFIVTAMQGEITRRLRKQGKEESES